MTLLLFIFTAQPNPAIIRHQGDQLVCHVTSSSLPDVPNVTMEYTWYLSDQNGTSFSTNESFIPVGILPPNITVSCSGREWGSGLISNTSGWVSPTTTTTSGQYVYISWLVVLAHATSWHCAQSTDERILCILINATKLAQIENL